MAKQKSISIVEKYNPQFEYTEALMLAILAYQYLMLWTNPGVNDATKIFQFSGLMAFEFVIVHSGAFMSVMPKKIALFFLVPFYGVFAYIFTEIIGNNTVLFIYFIAVLNRMRFAFFNVSKALKDYVMFKSALSAVIYFILLLIVAVGHNYIPELGLNPENLERINYYRLNTENGLFTDIPKTAISFGFLYYTALSLLSISLVRLERSKKQTLN